jgi:hypothetical protein
MLRVGFELTTSVFDRGNTLHVLDRAASVIGRRLCVLCSAEIILMEFSHYYVLYLNLRRFVRVVK